MMTDFPYEEPVPIVEPWLVVAAFALLALGALAGWLMSRHMAQPRDNAEAIWKAIDGQIKAAMKADDGILLGEAQSLVGVIQRKLGRTLALAKGLGLLKPLTEALDNRPPAPPSPGAGPVPLAQAVANPSGAPAQAEGRGADPAQAAAAAAAAAANLTIVSVGHGQPTGPAASPPPPPAPPQPMTAREQLQAVRLAVADLNQHWMNRADRIAEIRAAYRELSA